MTSKNIKELKKVMAELNTISDDKLIELPDYLGQALLQNMKKMLITLAIINKE